ncbi:MAG: WD40 repeat protein/predicted Ser/Thr protein kinase [Myxococcota bacterium]|jgi:WD40 repeat protein/predicted Ser/Thr protein kinase
MLALDKTDPFQGDDGAPAGALALGLAIANAPITDGLQPTIVQNEAPSHQTGPASQDTVPEAFGDYRVIRRIGYGGMGEVFEAEQAQPRRRVAIKVVHADQATASMRRRFEFEAEVLARLEHPGIARVYASVTDARRPYFVMEYVDGVPLTEWVDTQRLPLADTLELVVSACDAVHHVHMKGIIHRDLKPGNVLVDRTGRPRVLDFGIARGVNPELSSMVTMTLAGDVVGTPVYMSPEQASGHPDGIDARSDVYTLGVIAYELIAGELPYCKDSNSIVEIFRAVQEVDPPTLHRRKREPAPQDVGLIVGKAMSKEAHRRYQSADAMAADLRRFLRAEPIAARPPTLFYQIGRFARRNRALTVALAALALLLVGGVLLTTTLLISETQASKRAQTAALEAKEAANEADQARASLARHNDALRAMQARSVLTQDPTASLAWLKTLGADTTRASEAYVIALQAQREGVARHILIGHATAVRRVDFSPDGKLLATASYDQTVRIWDLASRTSTTLNGHTDGVAFVRFSPNGRRLVSGDAAGNLWLWTRSGEGIRLGQHRDEVTAARWTPDGHGVLTASLDGTIGRWDLVVRKGGAVVTEARGFVDIAVAGNLVAAANRSGAIRLCNRSTGSLRLLTGHRLAADKVVFAEQGKALLSAGLDGEVRRWDTATGDARVLMSRDAEVKALSTDGRRWIVLLGLEDGGLLLATKDARRALVTHSDEVADVAYSAIADRWLTVSRDRTVRLLSRDGETVKSWAFDHHQDIVRVSTDTPVAAVGDGGGTARVLHLNDPEKPPMIFVGAGEAAAVSALAFVGVTDSSSGTSTGR